MGRLADMILVGGASGVAVSRPKLASAGQRANATRRRVTVDAQNDDREHSWSARARSATIHRCLGRYPIVTGTFIAMPMPRAVAFQGERDTPLHHRPLILGLAGGTGSGKSTVARRVAEALRASASVAFIDMDAYYRHFGHLTLEERRQVNWDHPDALDVDLLVGHLTELAAGRPVEKPVYDFVRHLRAETTELIRPAEVVVVDGILLFVDERLRELCDVKVFVDADADVRLIRRLRRDMAMRGRPLDEILAQYMSTVRPMHQQFVEPSKRYADVIVPRGGHNEVAVEMIVARIANRLHFRGS